jgi:hypothetical protein
MATSFHPEPIDQRSTEEMIRLGVLLPPKITDCEIC